MTLFLKILSYVGLGLTLIPSVLLFMERITIQTNNSLMAVGMLLWFVTAPLWINRNTEKNHADKS
ncbi:hypothetical protein [Pararhodonellum marinum]|uniref:hypothetical protein n=1 Tax=Pararhodonellum marinum TaxID=2755358 RepID=UPI00188E67C9|nr:hypothetical protein [Pararhodonellum marinum]